MSFDKVLFKHDELHGHGEVYFIWQKGLSASYIASTGNDGTVAIFNRQGQLVERIILQGLCSGFAWDCEGDLLGIITLNSSQVTLWESNSKRKQVVDTGLRDPLSCLIWSKKDQILAIGTSRGNLAIYNHQTMKRIPILGKHSKRIICAAFSNENLLALGSDDKSFSISNENGDSLRVVQLRDIPTDMNFAETKINEQATNAGENTISMIIGKKTLFLYYLPEPDSPIELGFQSRYGDLIQHKWFGDGFILLGFSNGHLVAISTNPKDVGQELWQVKNHRDTLTGIAYCPSLDIVASCGDNTIKIHSISNLQETEKILTLPDQSGIQMIDWSSDGQLLALTTLQGSLYVFVTKLQIMYAVSLPRIAILSSIAEVSIYNFTPDRVQKHPMKLNLEIEPSFIAIGPYHLATGMNNHVWFYDIGRTLGDSPILLGDREFISEVNNVQLNEIYCSAICGSQLILQSIESNNPETKDKLTQSFPNAIPGLDSDAVITCQLLSNEFLIFATDLGHIIYFSLKEWMICIKYQHTMGIEKIYGDSAGIKLIFIDNHQEGFIFLPTNEESTHISELPKKCGGILWDFLQPNVFVVYDDKTCITYNFVRYSINGKYTIKIGETKLLIGQIPLALYNGEIGICVDGGKFTTQTLSTHLLKPGISLKEHFQILIKLKKFNDAYQLCQTINESEIWEQLGRQAIEDLNPEFALKIYRKLGIASMVFALQEIQYIQNLNLLSGFCCLLLDKVEEAKTFFVKSSNSQEALELCRDLLQWDQALILAKTLAIEQVPFIACEYAKQLEFLGNYSDALYHYEKGYEEDIMHGSKDMRNLSPETEKRILLCKAGIARTSIRTGDIRRGIQFAVELNDKQLYYDCAESLAEMGHLNEAAQLYEKGNYWDLSCQYYMQLKNWDKVNQLLSNVTNKKLHKLYAKTKEDNGDYIEAIKYYKISGDYDSCVRIYLEYLSDPHSASEIVLESRSIDGGKMMSKFYQRINDYEQSIQFLIICGCIDDAFSIAKKYNKIKYYGEILENYDNAQTKQFIQLAEYFENEKYTLLAGKYYFLGREFTKSLKLLLKAATINRNDENNAISLAIDCVSTSNNDQLSKQLTEFLLGQYDGTPKDPKYIFRLYMSRKLYKDASKTAVLIANQEQLSGNYRNAHDLLFSMHQELRRNNLNISSEMRHNLILIHRYTLVRIHVKLGNHLLAAKLLIRVAENISQFPSHVVPILTSTVIECHRAGLKKSAFNFATVLLRQEYRNQIDVKYLKRIENIVRKTPKGINEFKDDFEDETTECPICDANLSNMEVTCFNCKTILPICIATGQHITKNNMTACPECDFPCFRSEMEKILSETNQCPMCTKTIDSNHLMDIENIRPYILPVT